MRRAILILMTVGLCVACNQAPPAPPPTLTMDADRIKREPGETIYQAVDRLGREAAWGRSMLAENMLLSRRLAHVCPEAFAFPDIATAPVSNTTPEPLMPDDLLRYNRCAEASNITR